jgi:Protein of unknown function (DUF4238)
MIRPLAQTYAAQRSCPAPRCRVLRSQEGHCCVQSPGTFRRGLTDRAVELLEGLRTCRGAMGAASGIPGRQPHFTFDMWMTRIYTAPMAESPKGQKHHYIPVFYLKQWMGPKQTVCEFSRPRDRVKTRHVHPDGTGYVRGLYAIDDLDPDVVNAIENMFLKPSDNMAAEALHCLLRDEPFTHPLRMRHAWTRFLLSLLLRYPEAIGQMKKQLRENVERMYIEHRKPGEPETFAEYEANLGTNELARLHGKLMMDLMQDSKMERKIFGMNWGVVAFTYCKHELLTGDRPVVSNKFPISADHMCLPISPTILFFACETDHAEREFRRLDPGEIMKVMNKFVASRARTYVWGRDASQLRFVENRLGRTGSPEPYGIDGR